MSKSRFNYQWFKMKYFVNFLIIWSLQHHWQMFPYSIEPFFHFHLFMFYFYSPMLMLKAEIIWKNRSQSWTFLSSNFICFMGFIEYASRLLPSYIPSICFQLNLITANFRTFLSVNFTYRVSKNTWREIISTINKVRKSNETLEVIVPLHLPSNISLLARESNWEV